jgi:uncharacterized protein
LRTLEYSEVDDILLGATVLGCGGGGDPVEGRKFMKRAYDAGRAVTLVTSGELAEDALVGCPYGVGGLTRGSEDPYAGIPRTEEHPVVLAVQALSQYLGRAFDAMITGELGGASVADALYPAAVLGLPVVDADPVGRAVPELEQSMYYLHGLPLAPQAAVNEIGDTALITKIANDQRAEAFARALAVASRNQIWVADHALLWREIREVVIQGAISQSWSVGKALREAREAGTDGAAAVAGAGGGRVAFRGTITKSEWQDTMGFTVGETTLDGLEDDSGATYRIWFKNENLVAWRDGAPDVTCPDLICALDGDSGEPVTNPNGRVGQHLAVVGLPAPASWRTVDGLNVLGPRHFGFDLDYMPLHSTATS